MSCQLIFARSKLLPKDISVPRAELMATTLNAVIVHVVKNIAWGDASESLEAYGQPNSLALDRLYEISSEDVGAQSGG